MTHTFLGGRRYHESWGAYDRLELTAVVFIHVYGLVAWGDPTAGKDGKKTAAKETSTNINHPSFQDIMKRRFAV